MPTVNLWFVPAGVLAMVAASATLAAQPHPGGPVLGVHALIGGGSRAVEAGGGVIFGWKQPITGWVRAVGALEASRTVVVGTNDRCDLVPGGIGCGSPPADETAAGLSTALQLQGPGVKGWRPHLIVGVARLHAFTSVEVGRQRTFWTPEAGVGVEFGAHAGWGVDVRLRRATRGTRDPETYAALHVVRYL
ncbi:MAG: hypothetical protein U0132_13420 [Gemmatimonadaceae bacterium]